MNHENYKSIQEKPKEESKQSYQKKEKTIHWKNKGQEKKSIRRMPRHQEAKKDVTSCEKLWVGANIHQTTDLRMGQPTSNGIFSPTHKLKKQTG